MKLLFRTKPGVMIDDYDALMSSVPVMRKLGVKLEELPGGRYAYVPTGEAFEVEARGEYLKHAKAGELIPADKATADYCGLPYEPKAAPAPTTKAPAAVKES